MCCYMFIRYACLGVLGLFGFLGLCLCVVLYCSTGAVAWQVSPYFPSCLCGGVGGSPRCGGRFVIGCGLGFWVFVVGSLWVPCGVGWCFESCGYCMSGS